MLFFCGHSAHFYLIIRLPFVYELVFVYCTDSSGTRRDLVNEQLSEDTLKKLQMLQSVERRKSNIVATCLMFGAVPIVIMGSALALTPLTAAGLLAEIGGALVYVITA
jgi:hypothetical protein